MDIPEEIWVGIFSQLLCENIINIYYISHYFNNLCKKNDIFNKRKNLGFPRKSGHCVVHDIPNYRKYVDGKPANTKLHSELVLDDLYRSNCDLIRGDLISFGRYPFLDYFFTGCDLIHIYGFNGRKGITIGFLPNDFLMINGNIPKLYWDHKEKVINRKEVTVEYGIKNIVFCFNHDVVKKECIDNINQGGLFLISTEFNYNDKLYKISYHKDDEYQNDEKIHIEELKEILLKNNYLKLEFDKYDENGLILRRTYNSIGC